MGYKSHTTLGIIPARGGSKGVPGKNIRLLAGKPLIAWTIEQAKKSELLDRIIVSTDDPHTAEIAREYGAEVPFLRPSEISGDLAEDIEFIDHALHWLEENESYCPDIILRLAPTSPLRKAEHIDTSIRTLVETEGADSVRPIVEVPKHPYKFWTINSDSPFLIHFLPKSVTGFDEPHNLPRQLFPKVYMHTGAIDVIWTDTIRTQRSTCGKNVAYFFMDEESSINIDHPQDFFIAELFMNRRTQNKIHS